MSTKRESLIKSISIILIVLGLLFLLTGIFYDIPERIIPYNYKEYVGGDAYNLIIEAAIRGGEISGAKISKTIYIVFGSTLLIAGGILKKIIKHIKKEEKIIENNIDFNKTNY